MAVDYGATVYDASGLTYAGVPSEIWQSWDAAKQQKFLQDYYRTDEQVEAQWGSGGWDTIAYIYTGWIDILLGTEAVEVGETTNKTVDQIAEQYEDLQEEGKGLLVLLGLAYLATR